MAYNFEINPQYHNGLKLIKELALRPAGLEPATTRFEVWYSIRVSYERTSNPVLA